MLAVRFAVPPVPRIAVHRPALLERLAAGVRGPLTLVNGPAGAGKTVLAAQWITGGVAPRATAWLTVEPGDAPGAFWAHVLEAFHRHGVPLPTDVGSPTRAEGVDQALLVRLAAALAERREPVVLVLDQFDAVLAPEIAEGLQFVLRHASDGLRLLLTSRTDSLLPVYRYRAAGEITEIRHADLRFTDVDAERLLQEHGLELSEAGLRLLVERTEGWAAGLRLCALAMQRSADPEAFVREFAADRTTIAGYLLKEVLDAQPPLTQDLLLRVSITDRVHPDLADALTGRGDAEQRLAELAGANAFLEQVGESDWYRLHPLFAAVLHAHLRRRLPGLESRLRARAARWLAGTGRFTEAVVQAATAGDWQFAAGQLVDNLAIGRLFTGLETHRLRRAFAAMPSDLTGAAPALVEAACRLADQDLAGCTAALRRADPYVTGTSGPAPRLGLAFVRVLAGRQAGDLAATERAAADADRLLHEMPQPLIGRHPEISAMTLAALGSAELGAGHLDRSASSLTAAVAACGQPGIDPPLCDALASLSLAELLRGRLRQAEEHARDSLAAADRSALPPEHRPGIDHLVLAGVAAEHDDLTAARAHLDRATMSERPLPEPVAAVEVAVIGSRLATAEGDWEGALATVHAVGSAPAPPQRYEWTEDELAIAESSAHLAHGDAAAALDALDAVSSVRPAHSVARARALLAAGDNDGVTQALAGLPADETVTPSSRAQACLLQAQVAATDVSTGSAKEAHRLLREALWLARPEELRRVFVESGPWIRRMLRLDPQLTRAHSWLPARVLGFARAGGHGQLPVAEPLSERETEVLGKAAQLLSTEEIAAELHISANTVKTHLKTVYRKLSVTRRSEAVRRARDLGVL
ncbi:LuxR C-terminal-related transcriptional regulator [Streptomyces canus]|uniref:LuxR C-terminal-related transcriptional regulator n=1 Tax=Streptomyces canus TaxID=58343 RepID=UPI0022516F8B|nr:LuxR C-terminal-related transcriptional regulator [Streptomyces canus]MCX4855387.1 LuxR C-terminal-related transcriptional regulator [Streptomyces canus]